MSIAAVRGGLRTQALQTMAHISNHGVEPVQLSPWADVSELQLDLVHVFGASLENEGVMRRLHEMEIPLVLSPVFFNNKKPGMIKAALKMEKFIRIFNKGIHSDLSVRAGLCNLALMNFPNTASEGKLIHEAFSVPKKNISVIPNGVEKYFKKADAALFIEKYNLQDFVLFVGQAGAPRKNVIKLLEIAPKIDAPVVIIGSFFQDEYGEKCKQLAEKSGNVTLVETLPHNSELLASAYAAAKVFALPSLFETPGIAAMEAALAGAEVVITERGGTKEYFGNFAQYIDPNSSESLLKAIKKALNGKRNPELKQRILTNYTWDNIAKLTAENYRRLLH